MNVIFMKKTLALLLTLAMSVSIFAGCQGTAVVEKENTPKEVELMVKVDNEQVEKVKVKENVTNKSINVSGKGTIEVKVYIDGSLKKTVDMNLNNTTTLTIE